MTAGSCSGHSTDRTITVKATLPGAGYGYAAFSPDSKQIAVGMAAGEVDVWNLNALAAAPARLTTTYTSYGVAFTPDAQRVVSIDSTYLYVHSVDGRSADCDGHGPGAQLRARGGAEPLSRAGSASRSRDTTTRARSTP